VFAVRYRGCLNAAPAAEVLHVAIVRGKRAVAQTKITLRRRRNYSVPTAGAAVATIRSSIMKVYIMLGQCNATFRS